MEEKPSESETEEGPEEFKYKTSKSMKERIQRYRIPAAIVLVFVIAVLLTSTIDTSISGAAISRLEAENTNLKASVSAETQTLIAEKSNLELEKERLERRVEGLEKENGLYTGAVSGLINERLENLNTPFGFKISWDKYVTASPNGELVWFAQISNTGSNTRSFSLDLRLKSNPDKIFEKDPATGSLTLQPRNSGTLDVELSPKKEGYAIFGIYVNNNYVGDLIVFSL